jgi:hypothetical protein
LSTQFISGSQKKYAQNKIENKGMRLKAFDHRAAKISILGLSAVPKKRILSPESYFCTHADKS